MKRFLVILAIIGIVLGFGLSDAFASTVVPGHQNKYDKDDNGYPDNGATVSGHYTALYAYDSSGRWYWDLGDGRVLGTVSSVAELDYATITVCDYVVNYRGNFENEPFLDSGWIQNHINCKGYDDNHKYNYLIVHNYLIQILRHRTSLYDNHKYNYLIVRKTDPRYRGNPEWSIWGTWEYHTLTVSGFGNLVRPIIPP